jgi:ABC-type bacteriocin/lantibiotic exporter with double-glycine peptidase domain
MLRRPHLLVLDEATRAIDVEGEHAILERLLRVTPRPTIVAHRLESLRHCEIADAPHEIVAKLN